MMWGWEVNRGLAQQGVKGSMTSKFWRGPSWTSHSIDLSRYHRMQSPSSHSWHAVATQQARVFPSVSGGLVQDVTPHLDSREQKGGSRYMSGHPWEDTQCLPGIDSAALLLIARESEPQIVSRKP